MKLRLDKLLAESAGGTRSEAKQWIRQGKVQVDGITARRPEEKINPELQQVTLEGELLSYCEFEYYMLYKPAGVVSATTDSEHPVVVDLITESKRKDLFPIGRLDIDTEGLLLVTNDGALAHRLLSPRHHVDKTYLVLIDGILTEQDCHMLEEGMDIGDAKPTLPAVVEGYRSLKKASEPQCQTEVRLTIQEGRYHQVKRMFARLGKPVLALKRVRMGNLMLDERLLPGEYRALTEIERKGLIFPEE